MQRSINFFQIVFASCLMLSLSSTVRADECKLIYLETVGFLTQASKECKANFLNTPGGQHAIFMTKQCRNLAMGKQSQILRSGIDNFKKIKRELKLQNACELAHRGEILMYGDAVSH
jgi:hypothetical protein